MNYVNGEQVRLGDRVKLGDDNGGIVVCSIDTGEFSSAFPRAEWDYLARGVLIEFPRYGLIHYTEAEPGLALVERAVRQ